MKTTDLFICRLGLLLSVLAPAFPACSPDSAEVEDTSRRTVSVTLDISTKAPADDPESRILSLRVYAIQGKRTVAHYEAPSGELSGSTHSFTLMVPPEETTFYVIANEAAAGPLQVDRTAFTLSEGTTEEELKRITFSTLPADTDQGIPMTAVHTSPVVNGGRVDIAGLSRSVARLDLYFAKKGDGQVYISRGAYLYNTPQYGYLFPQDYDGTGYNHMETQVEAGGQDIHRRGGQVILTNFWPEDNLQETTVYEDSEANRETFSTTEKNPVTSMFEILEAQKDTTRYCHFQHHPSYIFANTGATEGYALKIIYRKDYTDALGENLIEFPAPVRLALPEVHANDRIRLFAHISASTFTAVTFNWQVTGWQKINQEIEFR